MEREETNGVVERDRAGCGTGSGTTHHWPVTDSPAAWPASPSRVITAASGQHRQQGQQRGPAAWPQSSTRVSTAGVGQHRPLGVGHLSPAPARSGGVPPAACASSDRGPAPHPRCAAAAPRRAPTPTPLGINAMPGQCPASATGNRIGATGELRSPSDKGTYHKKFSKNRTILYIHYIELLCTCAMLCQHLGRRTSVLLGP